MCACGSKTYSKGMCRRCYERARYSATATLIYTAAVPSTEPCTYDAAHQRVYYWRGRARTHTCPCGKQAEEWSYRGNSTYEMTGTRERKYARGRIDVVHSKWSTNPCDYDALCRDCHELRDVHGVDVFSRRAPEVPGVPLQNLSPETAQEAL
jgi:hypothetical protein